jgi:hypothetical protein
MKQSKQITLSLSDFATSAPDLKYSMRCKVISITYLGMRSINKEIGRILRRIEHWPQGSVQSFKILYQDAYGLGGEVKWDGEKAEVGQFLDPTLHLCIGAETEQRLGALTVKALPDSRKHALQSNLR